MSMKHLGCVILCGGESRRMGRPKAWLPFAGTTMLEHVLTRVLSVCSEAVIVAAPDQEIPPVHGRATVVRDEVSGRGPLQGLAAGLAGISPGVEFVFATATDVPFLQASWIRRLAERIGDHDLAIPEVGGYLHPLSALYRRDKALAAIRSLLLADRLRPVFLRETLKTLVLSPEDFLGADPGFLTLRNLNTPEDYEAAVREWDGGGDGSSA